MDILEQYPKLKDILNKWQTQRDVTFLTSEDREYLLGVYDGLTMIENGDISNITLSLKSMMEKLRTKMTADSLEERIKQGKILFDSRLLDPIHSYNIPFDNDEKLFIEIGQLNEKQLNYLNHQKEQQQTAEQKSLALKKTKEAEQQEIKNIVSKFDNDVITLLKNFVIKYGPSPIGDEYIKLAKILKTKNVDANAIPILNILRHLKQEIGYEKFVERMYSNDPANLEDIIHNFLNIYGDSYENHLSELDRLATEKQHSTTDLENRVAEVKEQLELENFKNTLSVTAESVTMNDCDRMNGRDFEVFLETLFKKMGYDAMVTKGSGDQGADLIIEKLGRKQVVQSKKSQNKISNKAVQEIGTAIKHYDADGGIVVTNNFFHDSAINLAKSNNIELIDRTKLEELLKRYPVAKDNVKTDSIHQEETDENGLPLLNDELFMKKIRELEGPERKPIEHRTLVKHLIKTRKFTENSANDMIWQMMSVRQIYESVHDHCNTTTTEIKKKLEEEDKRRRIMPQLFFDILRGLEGDRKTPVEEKLFVAELIKTGRFKEDEAKNSIRRFLSDASIYESKPGHYNRV
ncbi:restriction endonuclease [Candidatus Nitrosotenuis aquarius]|uniref:restriction endonuclease n=1 Tax=Candidatus Nitrosotenuis aquarius TaxID=1846278 RepID=UPI000C1F649E|nr:restriction endonuclease [Candidatus Nitrosotenuis aquarius]